MQIALADLVLSRRSQREREERRWLVCLRVKLQLNENYCSSCATPNAPEGLLEVLRFKPPHACLLNLLSWYKTLSTLRLSPPTLNLKSDEKIPCNVIGRSLSLDSDDDARRATRHVPSRIPKIQKPSVRTWLLHVLWHHPMTSPVHMGIGCITGVIPVAITHGKLEVMCATHPCNGPLHDVYAGLVQEVAEGCYIERV